MPFEYDDEASARWHHDVVREVSAPGSKDTWVEAMQRLNTISDPLARRLVRLHEDCGSGTGICDGADDLGIPDYSYWGCETLKLIAEYHRIAYPAVEQTEHRRG